MQPELSLLQVYVNEAGQLCDIVSHLPLRFAPHTHLHLLLQDPTQLLAPQADFEPVKRMVVPAGEAMQFELKHTAWGELTVTVRLLDDVWLFHEEEGKAPALGPAQPCIIESVHAKPTVFATPLPDFEPIQVDTLNQAYFQASKRYQPKRASHTANIYREMHAQKLGFTLRELWDIVGRKPSYWAEQTSH